MVALVVGAAGLFGVGLLLGLMIGRSAEDELALPSPSPSTTTTTATTGPPDLTTPAPGQPPAISSEEQVLQEGDRPVTPAASNAACGALIQPGTLGECGEVVVGGDRVVWVVEQQTTPTGAQAFTARIFTFVPDAGGWVEWLQATDPAGERWSDVNVLASDLTGDGVSELLAGFRSTGEAERLEYDIVGYSESNVPEVVAHPDPAAKGSVVVAGGTIQEYSAQYPNDEPLCCPPTYLLRTISFEDGFFRVVGSDTVLSTALPPSQL
jgi:hypothetical protein